MELFKIDGRENTKRIARVLGIKVADLVSLLHISQIKKYFPFNSYMLTEKQYKELKKIVELLRKVR